MAATSITSTTEAVRLKDVWVSENPWGVFVNMFTFPTEGVHIGEVWTAEIIRSQDFKLEVSPTVFLNWKYHGTVHKKE